MKKIMDARTKVKQILKWVGIKINILKYIPPKLKPKQKIEGI